MGWVALGGATALQLVAGVVRVRGWFFVIRHSCPDEKRLRYRDVVIAQLGGCGWNAILPARAGEAVKVALVARRMRGTSPVTLAGTLFPPAFIDAVITALLVVGLFATGTVSPSDIGSPLPSVHPGPVIIGAIVLALVLAIIFRRRLRRWARDARAGLRIMRRPKMMLTQVTPWHLASRAIRVLALALVLAAAGIPLGIVPALALMALQGATPSMAPAATAVRLAMIAGVFTAVGGGNVDPKDVAAALIAWYGMSSVANLIASGAVTAWVLRTASPKRIVAYARSAMANVGRKPAMRPKPPVARKPAASSAGS